MCLVFPSTLTKTTQRWFHQLPQKSISSFKDLAEKFRTQFITNVPPTKSIHDLRMCKHEVTESLGSYLDRFNKVVMQIENLSDEIAIEAMKNGTRLRKLKDKIMTKEHITFFEVMAMATKLIQLDEDRKVRREDDKTPLKKKERAKPRRPRPQRPYFSGSAGGPTSGFRKEIENYTSLNAPRSRSLCGSE